MDRDDDEHSFGVFRPVGHVVVSIPSATQADAAARALDAIGIGGDKDLRRYTDREMLERIERDLESASPLAHIGQEVNLIEAQRELAQRGYHWLVVRAPTDEVARRVATCVEAFGAERAQLHGRFIIEELIEHPTDTPQVAESPDRKLDAQTPSGEEAQRKTLRPGARRS